MFLLKCLTYLQIDDKVQLINRNGFRNLLEKHGILLDLEDSEEGTGKVKLVEIVCFLFFPFLYIFSTFIV